MQRLGRVVERQAAARARGRRGGKAGTGNELEGNRQRLGLRQPDVGGDHGPPYDAVHKRKAFAQGTALTGDRGKRQTQLRRDNAHA